MAHRQDSASASSTLLSARVPTQRIDRIEQRPHRIRRILPRGELDPFGPVGRNLNGHGAAVDRVYVHVLGHGHIGDLIRETLDPFDSAAGEPLTRADFAVVGDSELITFDRVTRSSSITPPTTLTDTCIL